MHGWEGAGQARTARLPIASLEERPGGGTGYFGAGAARRSPSTASARGVLLRTDARGLLHDISSSGARIEEASLRLKPGTVVRLTLPLIGEFEPVQVRGEVVRETETGFAVRFVDAESIQESLERWMDMARRQARGERS